jgi:hypothetical protein
LKLDSEFLNTVSGAGQGWNNQLVDLRSEKHCRRELEKLNSEQGIQNCLRESGKLNFQGKNQETPSATVFSESGSCWIELVNSKMKESCLANQGGETMNRACVSGLRSVNKVKLMVECRVAWRFSAGGLGREIGAERTV